MDKPPRGELKLPSGGMARYAVAATAVVASRERADR